ncbi:sorbosone dehydrogenase family protein [bacterium]|nr:MAG: sorbosone dehydrogenase family protein [bacterium]
MILPLALTLLAMPQETVPLSEPVRAGVVNPRQLTFSPDLVRRLRAPKGYRVTLFANGLKEPRLMIPLEDGTLLVSSPSGEGVFAVKEGGLPKQVLSGLKGAHGLARRGDRLYVAGGTEMMIADLAPAGELRNAKRIVTDLPQPGQHGKRCIAFGPDGMLYMTIGSRTNDRPVAGEKEDACILVMDPAGQGRRVFAKRLRNTMAFTWNPTTKEMWGFDQGADYRGDNIPPEELNRIKDGGDYGWPYVYGQRRLDPNNYLVPEGETSLEVYARKTEPSALELPAHSSPIATAFYDGALYVTMRGSWNRSKPQGYNITKISFDAAGRPAKSEVFVDGFLTDGGKAYVGRPSGLAIAADGTMYVSDDANGAIYKIARG